MKWIDVKMTELGVYTNTNYKITCGKVVVWGNASSRLWLCHIVLDCCVIVRAKSILTFYLALDINAMFSVTTYDRHSEKRVHNTKPLAGLPTFAALLPTILECLDLTYCSFEKLTVIFFVVLWAKFPESYSPKNTIHVFNNNHTECSVYLFLFCQFSPVCFTFLCMTRPSWHYYFIVWWFSKKFCYESTKCKSVCYRLEMSITFLLMFFLGIENTSFQKSTFE